MSDERAESDHADEPWKTVYDRYGIEDKLDYPETALHSLLRDAAEADDGTGLIEGDDEYDYDEVWDASRRLASALHERGVRKGDAVATLAPTSVEFLVTAYGVSLAGATNVPLSPLEGEETLVGNLEKVPPVAVVAHGKYAELGASLRDAVRAEALLVVGDEDVPDDGEDFWDGVEGAEPLEPEEVPGVGPEDESTVLFTGGTTGTPKGCVLTHRNVVANALQIGASMSRAAKVMRGNAEILNALPLYHAYGHSMAHAFVRLRVTQVLLPDPRNTEEAVEQVKEYGPTAVIGVPTQFMEMADDGEGEEMNVVGISGSAPLASETEEEFGERARGVAQGYGLSEMSPVTHFDVEGLVESISGVSKRELEYDHPTVGVPVPDTRIRLRDTETGDGVSVGEAVEEERAAEMLVDGPQRMKGYIEVDNDAVFDEVRESDDSCAHERRNGSREGYVRTGDVVRIDDEGRFYIVDRVKNMINVSGLKVYTEEVDEELHAHPVVARGATVGVPDPDRPGSELVKVYVETEDGAETDAEGVTDFLSDRVAKHAVPDEVEFVDEIPLTSLGKVDKEALKDRD